MANLSPKVFNSMLETAFEGLRMLDPATAQRYVSSFEGAKAPSDVPEDEKPPIGSERGPRPEEGPSADDDDGGGDSKKKSQKREEKFAEPQECLTCHAKSSPEWRRGPFGPRTLCNACGLVYIKIMKRRAKGLPDEEDEVGGDDDDAQESGYED